MLKYICLALMAIALVGCSTVTYTGKDVTITYTRFFAGSDGIEVVLGDESVAKINKQTIDTELLNSVLGAILGAAK
jgi:ABC-type glycerol-3-phosphate transport system substrate-binding protein